MVRLLRKRQAYSLPNTPNGLRHPEGAAQTRSNDPCSAILYHSAIKKSTHGYKFFYAMMPQKEGS